jgi:hypothetical protein
MLKCIPILTIHNFDIHTITISLYRFPHEKILHHHISRHLPLHIHGVTVHLHYCMGKLLHANDPCVTNYLTVTYLYLKCPVKAPLNINNTQNCISRITQNQIHLLNK